MICIDEQYRDDYKIIENIRESCNYYKIIYSNVCMKQEYYQTIGKTRVFQLFKKNLLKINFHFPFSLDVEECSKEINIKEA